uniref:VWACP-8 n=1 Tax=Colubraria reticulata TaxID=604273 RepID=A0AA96ZQD7_9CAEN|nr:VWACP-8 [Colubraria reticulata]
MWKINLVVAITLCVFSHAAFLNGGAHTRVKRLSPDCPEECAQRPLEISLVVDASSSIGPSNFARCLAFLEDFVGMFKISPNLVRVSMVTFGQIAYAEGAFGLDANKNLEDLKLAISKTPYHAGSATNTSGGIDYMLENQATPQQVRSGVRHVVMVITDGRSQRKLDTRDAARRAQNRTKDVFAIGVGPAVSAAELHTIASDGRHVIRVDSYDMLVDIKKRLAYEACNVPTFPECEMDPVDIAFVIDSSRSVGQDNFTKGMDFVRDFVQSFQVDPLHVRFAAVTYGNIVYEEDVFHFITYKTKKEVLDRLNRTVYHQGGATHTWEALKFMREQMMPHARSGIPRICIVITDGASQQPRDTEREAKLAQDEGIVTYAVGVGKLKERQPDGSWTGALNREELAAIAGAEPRLVLVDNYQKLNVIKETMINMTCSGILNDVSHRGASAADQYLQQL